MVESTVEEWLWATGNRAVHEAMLFSVPDYKVWMNIYSNVDTTVWRVTATVDEAAWANMRQELFR